MKHIISIQIVVTPETYGRTFTLRLWYIHKSKNWKYLNKMLEGFCIFGC